MGQSVSARDKQLRLAAWRLRLDVLTMDIHRVLSQAGIPHALLKGPTTAVWLYETPRHYRDIDMLIPRSRLHRTVKLLDEAGVAAPTLGKYGEAALHSLTMRGRGGVEVDLHVSLPLVPVNGRDPDRLWRLVVPHVVGWTIEGYDNEPVPALDPAGRCLTLALHLVSNEGVGTALTDLRLAVAQASQSDWNEARRLASQLGMVDVFDAALSIAADEAGIGIPPATQTALARLKLEHASTPQLRWAQLRAADKRELPLALARELIPTRDFMRYAGWSVESPAALVKSHVTRWRGLVKSLSGTTKPQP